MLWFLPRKIMVGVLFRCLYFFLSDTKTEVKRIAATQKLGSGYNGAEKHAHVPIIPYML